MGLFNSKLSRALNRHNKAKKQGKKHLYLVNVEMMDGERSIMEVKIQCPGNNKREGIKYFNDNIRLEMTSVAKFDKNPRRKRNIEMQSE